FDDDARAAADYELSLDGGHVRRRCPAAGRDEQQSYAWLASTRGGELLGLEALAVDNRDGFQPRAWRQVLELGAAVLTGVHGLRLAIHEELDWLARDIVRHRAADDTHRHRSWSLLRIGPRNPGHLPRIWLRVQRRRAAKQD